MPRTLRHRDLPREDAEAEWQPRSRQRNPTCSSCCRTRSNGGRRRFLQHVGWFLYLPSSCCTSRSASRTSRVIVPNFSEVHQRERTNESKVGNLEESSIDDNWNIDGEKTVSEDWIDFWFQILMKRPLTHGWTEDCPKICKLQERNQFGPYHGREFPTRLIRQQSNIGKTKSPKRRGTSTKRYLRHSS